VSTEYQYDPASRLTALIYRNALGSLGDLTYQYDTAGNRIRVGGSFARTLLPDPVPSATYDPANRQFAFGDKTMTFDGNGNLASSTDPSGVTAFVWDARNRLAGLSGSSGTASFTYDPLDRRGAKTINGQLSQFIYDGLDIVQQLDSLGATSYLRSLNIDEALSFTNRNGTYFSIYDPLGSTLGVTDSSAASVVQYTYAPFGATSSTDPAFPNPFQFSGRENDGLGMYYYRSRYYLPRAGRFVAEDPLGLAGGSYNLYLYARLNPLRFIDPTGLKTWIYVQASGTAGYKLAAGEAGTYFLVDPFTGETHGWTYVSGGVGLGFGAAAQIQVGVYDGPDDPTKISNWSLEVSGFAAAGKGASFSYTGTSFWGNGEFGSAAGPAGGVGAGISGQLVRSWYKGKGQLLPKSIRETVEELAKQIRDRAKNNK
jgi:RHS repeat-associated protein